MAVIDWFLMYLTFRRSVRLISGLRNRPDAGSREAVAVARTAVAPSVETGSGRPCRRRRQSQRRRRCPRRRPGPGHRARPRKPVCCGIGASRDGHGSEHLAPRPPTAGCPLRRRSRPAAPQIRPFLPGSEVGRTRASRAGSGDWPHRGRRVVGPVARQRWTTPWGQA
jgi:hypothetical protein